MSNKIVELMRENVDENGKLSCKDAFKISAKTKTSIIEIGKIAHKNEIRITDCDLGQFGKLDKSESSEEAKKRLEAKKDEKGRVTCKDARACAAGIGLSKIRGTLKMEKIEVVKCELGCFDEKKRPRMRVKTKTWIENYEGQLLFGKGKTEILEAISREKSIAAAAEEVGMNYKKAWSHVQILQKYLDDVLVYTQKGGGEQGGSFLTDAAYEYIAKYKQLQDDIENYANERFRELFLKPRGKKEKDKEEEK
ncbi:MAG: winged helix-turn-helix domain-containing protein [Campylobacteraceae bacterium]